MVVFFFLAGIVEVFVASVRPTSSWRAGGGVNFFLIQKTPWGGGWWVGPVPDPQGVQAGRTRGSRARGPCEAPRFFL